MVYRRFNLEVFGIDSHHIPIRRRFKSYRCALKFAAQLNQTELVIYNDNGTLSEILRGEQIDEELQRIQGSEVFDCDSD